MNQNNVDCLNKFHNYLLNNKTVITDEELNDMENKIVKMSFGIGCREYKQREIAYILGIPQYKISRIKNRSLKRLRNCINSKN